jgi:hypothetical protein
MGKSLGWLVVENAMVQGARISMLLGSLLARETWMSFYGIKIWSGMDFPAYTIQENPR